MSEAALLEVLIAEIEDNNQAFVDALLVKARNAIMAGGGLLAPLETGSLNGKSFQRGIRMDAAQVARVCRQALASADGGDVSATSMDFSNLDR